MLDLSRWPPEKRTRARIAVSDMLEVLKDLSVKDAVSIGHIDPEDLPEFTGPASSAVICIGFLERWLVALDGE
jgi:hypothetical protein